MNRDSFIFYKSWTDAMQLMNESERLQYYDAIIAYGCRGEMPSKDAPVVVQIAMQFVATAININEEKHQQIIETRRDAGKKGAEKRWQNHDNNSKNSKNSKSDNRIANDSKHSYNVNVNVNDNVNDNINLPLLSTNVSNNASNTTEVVSESRAEMVNWQKLQAYWNKLMQGTAIRGIKKLDEKRRTTILARIAESSKEELTEVIEKVAKSSFLGGANDRGFVATWDWVFTHRNYIKILEGNFDDSDAPRKPKAQERKSTADLQYELMMEQQEKREQEEREKKKKGQLTGAAAYEEYMRTKNGQG